MRIVAGRWRGRNLVAPAGDATRPTADRVRQALFDMLLHAPWGGPETIRDATVLDVFAGTGAMGLEALSRGARHVTFIENGSAALAALRANIRACQTEAATTVIAADVLKLRAQRDSAAGLVFLDPPYRQGGLRAAGFIAPGALIVAETARNEPEPVAECLAERVHGAARVTIWHESGL